MGVDGLLDTDGTQKFTGLAVRVYYNQTGTFEDCVVQHEPAGNYIQTTTYLGQSTASLVASDYTVGTNWHILEGLDDDTNNGNTTMEQKGNIDFILPQTTTRDWSKLSVNGTTCFWLRFRVTNVSGVVVPPTSADRVYWGKRDTFVKSETKQGQTRTQDPLASSDVAVIRGGNYSSHTRQPRGERRRDRVVTR